MNQKLQKAFVSGEWASNAISNLTNSVAIYGRNVTNLIMENKRRIGILKGEYYKYALHGIWN